MKIFFCMLLICVLVGCFTACSDYDDDYSYGYTYGYTYDYDGDNSYDYGKSGSISSCGHLSCAQNGPFYCMGKGNTCPNKTYCAYDLYCSSCG